MWLDLSLNRDFEIVLIPSDTKLLNTKDEP